jgi:uncharacterized ferredoxin-like protein
VVRPVALGASAEVSGTGDPLSYDVTFGYDGGFAAAARGLIPADVTPGTVAIPVAIRAGTTYARFS